MSRLGVGLCLLVATASVGFCSPDGSPGYSATSAPVLPVGWHDELADVREWSPYLAGRKPRLSRPRVGSLALSVTPPRQKSDRTPFYWASVYRMAEVDLDQYPILAVRTLRVSKGAWWDFMVQEVKNGQPVGQELKTESLREPGLLFLDLPKSAGLTGRKKVRIRLNVAHENGVGTAEYAWARFIQRSDVDTLRRNPDLHRVLLSP